MSLGAPWAPAFSPDGRELFYRTVDGLMTVSIAGEPELALGTPEMVFEARYRGGPGDSRYFDLADGGRRFLMQKDGDAAITGHETVVLVQNWSQELNELVPIN